MYSKTTFIVACLLIAPCTCLVFGVVPVWADEDPAARSEEFEADQKPQPAQDDSLQDRDANAADSLNEGQPSPRDDDDAAPETDERQDQESPETSPPAAEEECLSEYEKYQSDALPSVGNEATYFLRFAGEPLTAQKFTQDDPIRVWIKRTIPDCEATIYELGYVSDLAGRFDLGRFLLGADELEVANLEPALVFVRDLLPDDHHGRLEALPLPPLRAPLRYKLLLVLIGTLWFVPILWFAMKRRSDRQHAYNGQLDAVR